MTGAAGARMRTCCTSHEKESGDACVPQAQGRSDSQYVVRKFAIKKAYIRAAFSAALMYAFWITLHLLEGTGYLAKL
ncbi:hypothetical protein KSZ_67830 [Dictyobacter formicarum]|uniref:Uncharacterized protein n=1 Tax=Dictyobacter formicarum TaxID=2778368 RepID=A0ABQ3VSC3_9CHLR|nr:hypothetical protein KSZ_67830 [Dictyobacter formicarum]